MSEWGASSLTGAAVVGGETEKEAEILLSALVSAGPQLRLMELAGRSEVSVSPALFSPS